MYKGKIVKISSFGRAFTIKTEQCPHCGLSAYVRGVTREDVELSGEDNEKHTNANAATDGLKKFIEKIIYNVNVGEGRDFRFDLFRWSKDSPYWCVFACEHDNTEIFDIKGSGGHYCIGKEADLHEILSVLADSGWKVEIHQSFFEI